MSDKDTGGPAFPQAFNPGASHAYAIDGGMTLRDYFAAKAMQSTILAAMTSSEVADALNAEARKAEAIAKMAFHFADALLAERAK
jgi:hypothetical protein